MCHAVQRPPAGLVYHYQPFKGEHIERLRRILLDQKLYCSKARDFNDPWDCNPDFDRNSFEAQLLTQEGARYVLELVEIPLASRGTLLQKIHDDPILRAKMFSALCHSVEVNLERSWRIYCVSPSPTINLMWSHYAAGHTGVCLEFGLDNELFSRLWEVNYSPIFPMLKFREPTEDLLTKYLLTKSEDWSYEGEHRIIARPFPLLQQSSGKLVVAHDNFINLPKGALRSLIVGCKGNIDEVKKVVANCAPGLPVKKAIALKSRFELNVAEA